jgi:hypothetical protein
MEIAKHDDGFNIFLVYSFPKLVEPLRNRGLGEYGKLFFVNN